MMLLLSSPVLLCQECCVQKAERKAESRTALFHYVRNAAYKRKAEEGAEKWAGKAYYDSICDMAGRVLLFRDTAGLMQKCCHKNFYKWQNARYNQGK